MDLNEFLEKLRGDDLLNKNIKVERINIDRNPDGMSKITIYAQRLDEHGTLEKLAYTENSVLSCGHVGEVVSVCQCGSTFCKICASSNTCVVCHLPLCDTCRAKSFFHNKARCHKKCRWKFILNSLFER
jgi:hypothetical protein